MNTTGVNLFEINVHWPVMRQFGKHLSLSSFKNLEHGLLKTPTGLLDLPAAVELSAVELQMELLHLEVNKKLWRLQKKRKRRKRLITILS